METNSQDWHSDNSTIIYGAQGKNCLQEIDANKLQHLMYREDVIFEEHFFELIKTRDKLYKWGVDEQKFTNFFRAYNRDYFSEQDIMHNLVIILAGCTSELTALVADKNALLKKYKLLNKYYEMLAYMCVPKS